MLQVKLLFILFYGVVGSTLPYYPLYLSSIGFSTQQIGSAVGVQGLSLLFVPLITGYLSDRTRRGAILQKKLFALFCGITLLGIAYTTSFWLVLLLSFLFGVCVSPVFSLLDGAAVIYLKKNNLSVDSHYPRIRAFGSIGFILPSVWFWILSKLVYFDYHDLMLMGAVYGFVFFLSLFAVHKDVFTESGDKTAALGPLRSAAQLMTRKDNRAFFIATFAISVAMGIYYALFSLRLQSLGVSPVLLGAIYNFGVLWEVGLLFGTGFLLDKVGIRGSLILAAVATIIRFGVVATANSVWLITSAQIFHSLIIMGIAVISSLKLAAISNHSNRYSVFSLYQIVHSGVGRFIGSMILPVFVGLFVGSPLLLMQRTFEIASLLGISALVAALLSRDSLKKR